MVGSRPRLLHLPAAALIATPFVFAAIRAFTTRSDLRFLWMALASLVGAALILRLGQPRVREGRGRFGLTIIAFFGAVLFGGAAALLLGARSAVSVWLVATGFALCISGGLALGMAVSSRSARL